MVAEVIGSRLEQLLCRPKAHELMLEVTSCDSRTLTKAPAAVQLPTYVLEIMKLSRDITQLQSKGMWHKSCVLVNVADDYGGIII